MSRPGCQIVSERSSPLPLPWDFHSTMASIFFSMWEPTSTTRLNGCPGSAQK